MFDTEYKDPSYSTGRYRMRNVANNFNIKFVLRKVKGIDDLRSDYRFYKEVNCNLSDCMNCKKILSRASRKMSGSISQKKESSEDEQFDLLICCEKCCIKFYEKIPLIKNTIFTNCVVNGRVSCRKQYKNLPELEYRFHDTIVDYYHKKKKYTKDSSNKTVHIFWNCISQLQTILLVVLEIDQMMKIVKVRPDFNRTIQEPGYLLCLFSSSEKYVYWLIPTTIQSMKPEIYFPSTTVGSNFRNSSKNRSDQCNTRKYTSIHVFGEIKGAFGFEVDNIFIRYVLELPPGWMITDINNLSGVTHRSCEHLGFHSLGHLFEFILKLKHDVSHSFLPILHLEVLSLNAWRQMRYEGFTKVTLPQGIGYTLQNLQTVRLRTSPLRSFFLPSLFSTKQTITYSKARYTNKIPINTLGGIVEPSGEILIEFHIVNETNVSDHDRHCSVERVLSTSSLVKSVKSTIESYISARDRAQKAFKISL